MEISTSTGLGFDLNLICVDPGEGPALTSTEAILAGLGHKVGRPPPGKNRRASVGPASDS